MRLHCLYFTCNVPLERKPEKLLMHHGIVYKETLLIRTPITRKFHYPDNLLGNPIDWINVAGHKSSII